MLYVTPFLKSTFTLTFAVEILGVDVWRDSVEGRLELEPYQQAMRILYQLYPGQSFELDILIWPQVAKIWCGNQYAYVRTWQFLEERWLTFSIRHAFPVRVHDMLKQVATVTCSMGSSSLGTNAKNDKNFEAFMPRLKFGERRYFAPVLKTEETTEQFMQELVWKSVEEFIPASYLDGVFDTPYSPTDIRHQDRILSEVQESILNKTQSVEEEDFPVESEELLIRPREKRDTKVFKDNKNKEKKKIVDIQKEKLTISLPGDSILAGSGRIIAFETTGERPPEQSSIIVLISSNNLPAEDDYPIIFINVETLNDIPIQEFKNLRITQVFTRWKIGEEEHDSSKQHIKLIKTVKLNDHHTVPLQFSKASEITASFLDGPFEIQLRGVRQSKLTDHKPILFGDDKNDRNFGFTSPPKTKAIRLEEEVSIAVTKIDASSLAKETNGIIRGEFCLFPLKVSLTERGREDNCTNDINGIKQSSSPDILIKPSVILEAQMTLEVSIGVVGCRPRSLTESFLRLYCCSSDSYATNALLQKIIKINENLIETKDINDLLTGFALDTIDTVIFYVEGRKDGPILTVWEFTADFYPKMKPLFSCSDHHLDRIYSEMLTSTTPFYVLKMLVPINTLLACPQVYVKPSLPLPTRSALLKIGRLIASKFKLAPCKSEMPTNEELRSFRLELCIPPRPPRVAAMQ
ncbi:uncharacterized protein LOC123870397 isoform X2 [Maniola jurtina]|uniref:uncharacterized protein LOC123870397 isoform X2 n=1 Tax=Maniola jurtina TaxID=191418 RepID=UPI001E6880C6|nr:uncharacterized protein LOC123870397 isoform X2 [Maniola jurtina]